MTEVRKCLVCCGSLAGHHWNARLCSAECKSTHKSSRDWKKWKEKQASLPRTQQQCVVCDAAIPANRHRNAATCSEGCRIELRREHHRLYQKSEKSKNYRAEYYEANKEKIKSQAQNARSASSASRAERYSRHREEILDRRRRRYWERPEIERARSREWSARQNIVRIAAVEALRSVAGDASVEAILATVDSSRV